MSSWLFHQPVTKKHSSAYAVISVLVCLAAWLVGLLLQAQPWVCVGCQLQHEKQQRATKLYLHPMSYLNKPQPFVYDMGPTPACSSQECGMYATKMAQQMMAEVIQEQGDAALS
jgi:hypothetical protein